MTWVNEVFNSVRRELKCSVTSSQHCIWGVRVTSNKKKRGTNSHRIMRKRSGRRKRGEQKKKTEGQGEWSEEGAMDCVVVGVVLLVTNKTTLTTTQCNRCGEWTKKKTIEGNRVMVCVSK